MKSFLPAAIIPYSHFQTEGFLIATEPPKLQELLTISKTLNIQTTSAYITRSPKAQLYNFSFTVQNWQWKSMATFKAGCLVSHSFMFSKSQQVPFLHTFLAHSSMIFWVNGYDKQILAYRVKKDNPCEHKIFHNKFQSQNSVQQGSWKKSKCTFQPFLLQQGSTAQLTSSNTSRDLQTATLLLMLLDAFLGTSHQTLSSSNQIGSGTSQKAHSSLACFTHSYYTYTV